MDSHRAKRSALRNYCNELRQAINADFDNLSFKLHAESLIPQEVRDSKAADKIVASVENRLGYDESAWDKLIKVLYGFEGSAVLADKLIKQFTAEMSGQDAHRDNAPEKQRQNGSGLYIACCMMTIGFSYV